MKLPIEKARQMLADKHQVRPLTWEELRQASTDLNTVHPYEALHSLWSTVERYQQEHGGTAGLPELEASHLTVTHLNGKASEKDLAGRSTAEEVLQMRSEGEVKVSLKYDRVRMKILLGTPQETTDVVLVHYLLDRNKLQIAAGRHITMNDTLALLDEDQLYRGNTQQVLGAQQAFEQGYLQRFERVSAGMDARIAAMQANMLTERHMDSVFSEHHLLSAYMYMKQRRGIRQVFDDGTLKTAHWLLYNSIHDYRFDPSIEENMSEFDFYNCFTEALRGNDKDMTTSFDKYLGLSRYFREGLPKHL